MSFHRPAPCPARRFVESFLHYAIRPDFSIDAGPDGVCVVAPNGERSIPRSLFVATPRQRAAAVRLLQHLDRRSHGFPSRHVFRRGWESHYAPEISDAEALDLCRAEHGWNDVLILRFHSDIGLQDMRRAVNPEPVRECRAYDTVRFGRIYGQTYALPCLSAGRRDRYGRPIFVDEAGEFVVDFDAGCPEYPAVGCIERPAY